MIKDESQHLRVLIANERRDRLELRRRAVIEQAKGILMARHSINADKAFELLRDHSQHNAHKLNDVAAAIVNSHLLLIPQAPQPAMAGGVEK